MKTATSEMTTGCCYLPIVWGIGSISYYTGIILFIDYHHIGYID